MKSPIELTPALAWRLIATALALFANSASGSQWRIDVVQGGWGGTEPAEIGQVVAAVTDEFPPPGAAAGERSAIRIRHRFGGPMINHESDSDGSIVVYLSARDSRWYQFVYQFAHEYCHLLARFDRKQRDEEIVREQQWFEESLCETASLFALRRLSAKWRDGAAHPQLREAAPQLDQYTRQLLSESHRCLAAGTSLAAWYARHRAALQGQPYQRELNELVAAQLLPLFEGDPKAWSALASLNATPPSPGQDFSDFLAAWGTASPADLKPFVNEIRIRFGMPPIPADAPRSPSPLRPVAGPECGN